MTNSDLEKLENSLDAWSETHRYDMIIDIALKILAIDNQHFFATYCLLKSYNNTMQYEKLAVAVRNALAIWPDRDVLYEFLYLYYLSVGGDKYIKARDAIRIAIELNPEYAGWYRDLAEIYLINREPEKAEKYLITAVELSPDNSEYKSRLALSQIRLHKVNESIDLVTKALAEEPDDQHVLDNAGMVYLLSGEIEKAEELFKDALRRFPTYNYFQSHLDWVLREKADKESRLSRGLKYTPLYLRQNDRKRFFDEDKE